MCIKLIGENIRGKPMKEKSFARVLLFCLFVNVLYLCVSIVISRRAVGDDLEHIHAAWLIGQGLVPYLDFFEHHHPLMWFLFAPLATAMSGNMLIFWVIRIICFLTSLATIYVIYRLIKDFWGDKITALVAINIFLYSNIVMDSMVQFKPDTFMHFFFFLGLYLLFRFWRENKQKYLNLAALSWAVSFLFLQNLIFLLFPTAVFCACLLAAKKMSWKSALKALPWAVVPLLMFLAYLLYTGSLQRYVETNWLLNSRIAGNIWTARIKDFSCYYGLFSLGIGAAVFLLCSKPNKYLAVLLLMWLSEMILRTTYMSMWMYYYKIVVIYNAILISVVVGRFYARKNWVAWVAAPVMIGLLGKFWLFEGMKTNEIDTLSVMQVTTTIAQNSTPDDVVIGLPGIPFGVFNKNPHYYWFSWGFIGRFDERYFHYAEPFDINKVIAETKPKFVYYEEHKKRYPEVRKKYAIDFRKLQETYRPAVYDTLFTLKDN